MLTKLSPPPHNITQLHLTTTLHPDPLGAFGAAPDSVAGLKGLERSMVGEGKKKAEGKWRGVREKGAPYSGSRFLATLDLPKLLHHEFVVIAISHTLQVWKKQLKLQNFVWQNFAYMSVTASCIEPLLAMVQILECRYSWIGNYWQPSFCWLPPLGSGLHCPNNVQMSVLVLVWHHLKIFFFSDPSLVVAGLA